MKKSNKSLFIYSIGIALGGIIGYFYWKEIGCSTGTCPITSKPLNSVMYFAFLGYLGTNFVKDKIIKS